MCSLVPSLITKCTILAPTLGSIENNTTKKGTNMQQNSPTIASTLYAGGKAFISMEGAPKALVLKMMSEIKPRITKASWFKKKDAIGILEATPP